jgi:hypothetical protein
MINFIEMRAGMGWQASGDSPAGGTPGGEPGLPGLAARFEHGGPWETAAPSAALAFALERAAGPEDPYDGAETDALVGIARQWAAVESWAAAGKLAALRAMMREDSGGRPLLRRRSDLPDGWDDSLTYEISGALAMGPVSAGNLASLAWALGTRLAGTGRLLAGGTLTMSKAKLVAQLFAPLDDVEAARAEALILGELAGKTYPQVERLAWRAALAVAPDAAERRRLTAEREHARVTVFREDFGTVGLSGRDLPAAEALSGHANVVARAAEYEASGAFPGQGASRLQALAYTDLLNGVGARDRIAFARTAAEPPPGPPDDGGTGPGDGDGGPGPSDGDGRGGPDQPSGGGAGPGDRGHGPDEPGDGDGDGSPGQPDGPQAPAPPLAEVTVPLATLQGRAERAGDNRLLGPLGPALARDLAAAAARSPASRWELTIVRRARARRRPRRRPPGTRQPAPTATARPRLVRAARPGQHHHHRELPAPAANPIHASAASPGGPATPRGTTGRLGAHHREPRNLDTHLARRPAAGRPARRRAHPRLRPRLPGQLLPAGRAAAPAGPGPRPHLHLAAVLPPRAGVRFRARRPVRQGRGDLRL